MGDEWCTELMPDVVVVVTDGSAGIGGGGG